MALGTVSITGIRELDRALGSLSKELRKELRAELRKAAEPARAKAEALASGSISHIGSTWSRMRLGVTGQGVYLAPRARRSRGSSRPNLGPLLLNKAMWPAAQESEDEIARLVEEKVGGLIDSNGLG